MSFLQKRTTIFHSISHLHPSHLNYFSLMKEVLDNDQEKEIKAKKCLDCKLLYGHSDFEHLCSICFKKKKAEQNMKEIKLEEYSEEQDSISVSLSQECQSLDKLKYQNDDENESHESEQTTFHIQPPLQIQKEVKLEYECFDFFLRKIKKEDQIQKELKKENIQTSNKQQFRLSLKRGPPQLIKVQNDRCHSCSKRLGLLGFQCGYCHINFCKSHRIPQQHDCIADYLTKGRKRLKTTLLQNSITKKHKGKVLEI